MVRSTKSKKSSCGYAGWLTRRVRIDAIITCHLKVPKRIVRKRIDAKDILRKQVRLKITSQKK